MNKVRKNDSRRSPETFNPRYDFPNQAPQSKNPHTTGYTAWPSSPPLPEQTERADNSVTDTLLTSTKNESIQTKPIVHTDTLQFIHFEGNFDYWSCVFLNNSKDTITLVTDSMIADNFKNRLFEVKWFTDTLVQAGDDDSKFAATRMSHFRPIKGKPFAAPITEEQILMDVRNIPEVQSGAEQVVIAERPSDGKNCYVVETGTHDPST
jgi:hypothetical protein